MSPNPITTISLRSLPPRKWFLELDVGRGVEETGACELPPSKEMVTGAVVWYTGTVVGVPSSSSLERPLRAARVVGCLTSLVMASAFSFPMTSSQSSRACTFSRSFLAWLICLFLRVLCLAVTGSAPGCFQTGGPMARWIDLDACARLARRSLTSSSRSRLRDLDL